MEKQTKKRGESLERDISFLNQLILTLEQAELKLEDAHRKNNPNQFRYMKEFILKIQNKIDEVIK